MGKPQILYVDDERHNLVSFKASFRQFYQIYTAQEGEEALSLLEENPGISLIISDQRMPRMTGVEMFERVVDRFPDPIRMIMTGYSDIEAVIRAINHGRVYYYITKPWKREELKLVLDNALEAFRLKTENRDLTEERNSLLLEAEKQAKAQLQSQFETLKNQVNPHFLFNSLNVLMTLVHDDPDLAEAFIAKLTKVYRYVLELKDKAMVSLTEELDFVQNYIFLQQIRFGNNLRLYSEVPPQKLSECLPPLTLQLLVENAVKHNIISRQQPLTIELYIEDDFFVVKNNFQKREERIPSTGIGLANLKARYAFLSNQQPAFYLDNDHYIAKVPLLPRVTNPDAMP
ncbi:MAG: histidine kinase [Bacteroidota bacterium]